MSLLRSPSPQAAPTPGVLASRRQAGPALLRMLTRARRARVGLLLVRLDCPADANPDRRRRFLHALAAGLRINDLAWWEPEWQAVLLLLEAAEPAGAALARIEGLGRAEGIALRTRAAAFPGQGLTLAALMERLA